VIGITGSQGVSGLPSIALLFFYILAGSSVEFDRAYIANQRNIGLTLYDLPLVDILLKWLTMDLS
jgi:hypothetical protein